MVIALTGTAFAGDSTDAAGIERAVQNYVSALYDMKPELLDESVSRQLKKVGYMPAEDGMFDPETSPREVTILGHSGLIASVKLDAAWGIDYIHLTKFGGEWMIMNVIWQMRHESE
jgi:hypothetical protein